MSDALTPDPASYGLRVCAECDRAFDMFDPYDADEWLYGHDCEVSPYKPVREWVHAEHVKVMPAFWDNRTPDTSQIALGSRIEVLMEVLTLLDELDAERRPTLYDNVMRVADETED